jgi:DNA polymerase-3 subunit epsilon
MDGTVVFNFGKYVGESVKVVLTRERHYAGWILEKEFSSQVKQYIRQVMKEIS